MNMIDHASQSIAVLKDVRNQDTEMAVRTAKKMIFAAADLIACERGPEEARRVLRIAIAAQGQ
jgi:hypothetical protein